MRVFVLLAGAGLALGSGQVASAADMPVKAPVFQIAAYNWTGWYVGAHGGGGWSFKGWTDVTAAPLDEGSHNASGGLAGGQIGYNWQSGPVVIGVEAQASWANLNSSHVSLAFPTDSDRTRVDALGTFAVRLGYAWDRLLFYAKGGGAWAHDKFSITDIPSGITYANFTQTRWGWMVGAGVEHGITGNWSAKLEYNYMDFGSARSDNVVCSPNFGCTGPGGSFNESVVQRIQLLKAGINYRFGGPLVAKY